MLVLSRMKDESIIVTTVEGRIEIKIVQTTRSGIVRLGITAPKNVPVHRKEIQMLVDKEKEATNGAQSHNTG